MKILIIPSITLASGTGLRLLGLASALSKYCEVEIVTSIYDKIFKDGDVVLASKSLPQSCLFALMKKGIKVLDYDDVEWDYWKGNWKEPILRECDKYFPPKFNYITTHTENLKTYLINNIQGTRSEQIIMLPQGIEYDYFKNRKSIKKEYRTLMWTGHLGVAANLEQIFKVYKDLDKPDTKLMIVGTGTKLEYYKKLAEEMKINVFFTGYISHENIMPMFELADILVNYYPDTFANECRASIKIREALAAGLPVVSNTIGELRDFAQYIYGFNTGDTTEFKQQILKALEPDSRVKKGKVFVKKFDWKIIAKEFHKKLVEICPK
jgi:glycosyltransferase involved in cell wall biosynthesis